MNRCQKKRKFSKPLCSLETLFEYSHGDRFQGFKINFQPLEEKDGLQTLVPPFLMENCANIEGNSQYVLLLKKDLKTIPLIFSPKRWYIGIKYQENSFFSAGGTI